ncbi:protein kinase [Streptomyces sp. NPDC002514]|uniref:protein kinase n=1 Tax=Streptomyces sp. NPDC001270 TaxID=3364554 RepID=UPI0036AAD345
MDDYAGRVLADRYRLPLPPSDEYELTETRAFDTYSGQEVLIRQVPLPEVVEAEVLDADGLPDGFTARDHGSRRPPEARAATRRPLDPAVRRAVEAAQAAARIPDHPRLDQVFDVFAEGGSLWIVSEWVAARPLSALLVEHPLTPYRAAEVASDVLMALRVLHAHGWVHRNITARTVLVCDDGRVMLTGLAVGAAEEALSGYDPVPPPEEPEGTGPQGFSGPGGLVGPRGPGEPVGRSDPAGQAPAPRGALGPGGTVGPGLSSRTGGALGPGGPGGPGGEFGAGGAGRAVGGAGGPVGPGGTFGSGGAGGLGGGRAVGGSGGPAGPSGEGGSGGPGHVGPDGSGPAAGGPGGPVGPGRAFGAGGPDGPGGVVGRGGSAVPGGSGDDVGRTGGGGGGTSEGADPEAARRAAIQARAVGGRPAPGAEGTDGTGTPGAQGRPAPESGEDIRAARAGAIAAYRAGARAAARVQEAQQNGRPALPGARPPADGDTGAAYRAGGAAPAPYPPGQDTDRRTGDTSPGQIADPYGVRATPWHGASPRGTQGGDPQRTALPQGGHPPVPSGAAQPPRAAADSAPAPAHWGGPAVPAGRGPATALAAERARQVRMTVVGPVTERWAPEQAGPVHENWQLAAPIGPVTDLWALGALLFRAVQGHAPYPEESTAELVQLVCAEPPAFAEECGPLRPVVESLLRQDPTERPDFEELSGWLRSLVRSAPEPDAGTHVVPAPPADPKRLPILRRRGELVRRRRARLSADSPHGRHKRARDQTGSPRRLGRTLLLLVLLLMVGGVAYAMLFMPKAGSTGASDGNRTGTTGQVGRTATPSGEPGTGPSAGASEESSSAPSAETQTTSGASVADGFTLRNDPDGFQIAVADGWDRTPRNGRAQVVYSHGDFQLIVVPGRDSTAEYGSDPMVYQRDKESELRPYRASSWATASGLRTIEVGGRTMAEGQFTWTDEQGRDLFVRNIAILLNGRYHVVQVRGPEAQRDEVTRLYEQASQSYKFTR